MDNDVLEEEEEEEREASLPERALFLEKRVPLLVFDNPVLFASVLVCFSTARIRSSWLDSKSRVTLDACDDTAESRLSLSDAAKVEEEEDATLAATDEIAMPVLALGVLLPPKARTTVSRIGPALVRRILRHTATVSSLRAQNKIVVSVRITSR